MRIKNNNLYPCSQPELFSVARLGWNNCLQNLYSFSKFRKYYSQKIAYKMLREIDNASKLPSNEMRDRQISQMRDELLVQSKFCLLRWKTLKRYIINAFPKIYKLQLKSAGNPYLEKALNQKWLDVDALMLRGSQFIDRIFPQLNKNQNMPISFIAEFEQSSGEFRTLYSDFLIQRLNAPKDTFDYITHCNNIHKTLMSMLLDGQCIFDGNRILKKQFTFSHLLKEVRKNNIVSENDLLSNINSNPQNNIIHISPASFPVKLNKELTEGISW